MKSSVNETEVSLKSSCKDDNVFSFFFGLEKLIFLIIRIIVDKDDYNDYNDYKDD